MTVSTATTGAAGPLEAAAGEARLGTGVRFPLRPGSGGGLGWVAGAAAVRQSVETILDTEPGERIMRPTFGCGLRRHLMAPNTPATRTAIAAEIAEALTAWEPRIRVTEVAVTPGEEPTLVWIDIAYVHLLDLRPANLVYPFYLR
ncbi:GPW/gp25 family protein [Streptomyces sp. NBC_00354]|uniref:GPW/gp25 family protein n=1 Tax=Streptomyces sp. NBC_00354 TaxID=2975723 RepID=UPI002E2749D2|nr:GPW/gp25 family protein [Streptomyces sp. NBC_01001]